MKKHMLVLTIARALVDLSGNADPGAALRPAVAATATGAVTPPPQTPRPRNSSP